MGAVPIEQAAGAMHPEDIKAGLRKKYGTVAAFERREDLPARSVKDVLAGKSRPDIARAIAKALNLPPHVLFPDRFSPNGDALSKRAEATHGQSGATPARDSHRLSETAQ